ncbi:MAG: hypothetical protein AAGF66_13675 [Cyanobacteria bacterium P01_H01_bin.119]
MSVGLNPQDVSDDELIYRRIPYDLDKSKNNYKVEDGLILVSSQAFSDREMCPSVDRAKLCNHNPHHTQSSPDDGVVSFICAEIRAIDDIKYAPPKGQVVQYKIDIIWRPIDGNYAHSQIEPSPNYNSKSTFRKLREKLAYIANQKDWEIYPLSFR